MCASHAQVGIMGRLGYTGRGIPNTWLSRHLGPASRSGSEAESGTEVVSPASCRTPMRDIRLLIVKKFKGC